MKRLMFGILMAFGLVSMSFGVDLYSNEEPYQKLKAEVEMTGKMLYDSGMTSAIVDDNYCTSKNGGRGYNGTLADFCKIINIVVFFDELRAMEVEKNELQLAVKKVREMPRFKNDSTIYAYTRNGILNPRFWEFVERDWDMTKVELNVGKALNGVWKRAKETGSLADTNPVP